MCVGLGLSFTFLTLSLFKIDYRATLYVSIYLGLAFHVKNNIINFQINLEWITVIKRRNNTRKNKRVPLYRPKLINMLMSRIIESTMSPMNK